LAEEVESELRLFEEFVPEEVGESGVDACQNSEEVCFEGADGPLSDVVLVYV
jgi:hypothetical protein